MEDTVDALSVSAAGVGGQAMTSSAPSTPSPSLVASAAAVPSFVGLRRAGRWRASAAPPGRKGLAHAAAAAASTTAAAVTTSSSSLSSSANATNTEEEDLAVLAAAATGVRCFSDSASLPGAESLTSQASDPPGSSRPLRGGLLQELGGDEDAEEAGEGSNSPAPVRTPSPAASAPYEAKRAAAATKAKDAHDIKATMPAVLVLRDGRSALAERTLQDLTAVTDDVSGGVSSAAAYYFDEDGVSAEAACAAAVAQCAIGGVTSAGASQKYIDFQAGLDVAESEESGAAARTDHGEDRDRFQELQWMSVHNEPVVGTSSVGGMHPMHAELGVSGKPTTLNEVLRAKLSAPVMTCIETPLSAAAEKGRAAPVGALRSSRNRSPAFSAKPENTGPQFQPARVLAVQQTPGELRFHIACRCARAHCGHHSVEPTPPTGGAPGAAKNATPAVSPNAAGFGSLFSIGSEERKNTLRLNSSLRQCITLRCRRPGDLILSFYWLSSGRSVSGTYRHRLLVVTSGGCEVYSFPPSPKPATNADTGPKKRSWFTFGRSDPEAAPDSVEGEGFWQWTLLAEHRVVDSSSLSQRDQRRMETTQKTTVDWHIWSLRHRVLLLSPASLASWKTPKPRDGEVVDLYNFVYSHALIPLHFGVPKPAPAEDPMQLDLPDPSDMSAQSSPSLVPLPVVRIPVSVLLPRLIMEPADAETEEGQLQVEQYNVAAKSVLSRCRLRACHVALHQLYAKLYIVHLNTHRSFGVGLWQNAQSSMAEATGQAIRMPRNFNAEACRASVDLWQVTRDAVDKTLNIPLSLDRFKAPNSKAKLKDIITSLGSSVCDNILAVHTIPRSESAAVRLTEGMCLLFDVKDSDPQQPIAPASRITVVDAPSSHLGAIHHAPFFVSVEVSPVQRGGPFEAESVGQILSLDIDTQQLADILCSETGLKTPKKAVEVLLKRSAKRNKRILISVMRNAVLNPWLSVKDSDQTSKHADARVTASQTTHLAGMFDMLNFVLAHSPYKTREDVSPGASHTQNGCIVVLQSDMFAEVLSPLVDMLHSIDETQEDPRQRERYVRGVFLEYLRSLSFSDIPPQPFIAEVGVQLLARQKQYTQLHQLVQFHVIPDSVPVACTLLALSAPQGEETFVETEFGPAVPDSMREIAFVADSTDQAKNNAPPLRSKSVTRYPPAAQLAIDMLKRLSAAASASSSPQTVVFLGKKSGSGSSSSVPYGSAGSASLALEQMHDAQSLRTMIIEALLARHQTVAALRYTLSRAWFDQLTQECSVSIQAEMAKASKAQQAELLAKLEKRVAREQDRFLALVLRQATRVLEGAALLPTHAAESDLTNPYDMDEVGLRDVKSLKYKRYHAAMNSSAHADFFVVFHAARTRHLLDAAITEYVETHMDRFIPVDAPANDVAAISAKLFDSTRHPPKRANGTETEGGLFGRLLGRTKSTPKVEPIAAPVVNDGPRPRRGNSIRTRDITSEAVSLYAEEFGLLRPW